MSSKIIIDLDSFEGKTVSELQQEIYTQLNKIRVFYSAPNPMQPNRLYDYKPYLDYEFKGNVSSSTVIKKVELGQTL